MKISERHFQAAVEDFARWNRWLVYHPYNSMHSMPGFPDLCMTRNGVVIFAELKSAKGRVRPAQRQWLDALGACPGVQTYLWREPESWAEIKRVLG